MNTIPLSDNQESIKARAALKALHYYPLSPANDEFHLELVSTIREQLPGLINQLVASDAIAVFALVNALLVNGPEWVNGPAGHAVIDLPQEFIDLCESVQMDPEKIIGDFIRNLCQLPGSQGSDERRMANQYFDRVGYRFWIQS